MEKILELNCFLKPTESVINSAVPSLIHEFEYELIWDWYKCESSWVSVLKNDSSPFFTWSIFLLYFPISAKH